MVNMVEEKENVRKAIQQLKFRNYTEGKDEVYLGKLRGFVEKFDVDIQSYKLKGERVAHNLHKLYNKIMVSSHILGDHIQSVCKELDYNTTSLDTFEKHLKDDTPAYEYIDLMVKILGILERYARNLNHDPDSVETVGDGVPGLNQFYSNFTHTDKAIDKKLLALRDLIGIETGILSCYGRILYDFYRLGIKYTYQGWDLTYSNNFDPENVFETTMSPIGDVYKVHKALSCYNVYVNTMNFYYKTIFKLTEALEYEETKNALVMRNVAENHVISCAMLSLYDRLTYQEPNTNVPQTVKYREGDKYHSAWYQDELIEYFDPMLLIIRNILIRTEYDFSLVCKHIDNIRSNMHKVHNSENILGFYTVIQTLLQTFGIKRLRGLGFYTIDVLEHTLEDVFKKLRIF